MQDLSCALRCVGEGAERKGERLFGVTPTEIMGEVSAVVVTPVSQAAEESTQATGGSLPAGSALPATRRGSVHPRTLSEGALLLAGDARLVSRLSHLVLGDGTDHCA